MITLLLQLQLQNKHHFLKLRAMDIEAIDKFIWSGSEKS